MFKLLILDIDGVMTDGTKIYGLDGVPIAKQFYDHDFTAIKRFIEMGIKVCFLSGDKQISEKMAQNRNIDYYYNEIDGGKGNHLQKLCEIYDVRPRDVAYIGDDYYDLGILDIVGYPMCPQNATKEVIDLCGEDGMIIRCDSGKGVIRQLYEYIQDNSI